MSTYWKKKNIHGRASICDDKTVWQINGANPDNWYTKWAQELGETYGLKVVEDIL